MPLYSHMQKAGFLITGLLFIMGRIGGAKPKGTKPVKHKFSAQVLSHSLFADPIYLFLFVLKMLLLNDVDSYMQCGLAVDLKNYSGFVREQVSTICDAALVYIGKK